MSEWREVALGEVLTLQRGFDLPSRERVAGPVPIVSSSRVTGRHTVAKADPPRDSNDAERTERLDRLERSEPVSLAGGEVAQRVAHRRFTTELELELRRVRRARVELSLQRSGDVDGTVVIALGRRRSQRIWEIAI